MTTNNVQDTAIVRERLTIISRGNLTTDVYFCWLVTRFILLRGAHVTSLLPRVSFTSRALLFIRNSSLIGSCFQVCIAI